MTTRTGSFSGGFVPPRRTGKRESRSIQRQWGLPETVSFAAVPAPLFHVCCALDISGGHFSVLVRLIHLWNPTNGTTISTTQREVAEALPITASRAQQILIDLGERGLIYDFCEPRRRRQVDLKPLIRLVQVAGHAEPGDEVNAVLRVLSTGKPACQVLTSPLATTDKSAASQLATTDKSASLEPTTQTLNTKLQSAVASPRALGARSATAEEKAEHVARQRAIVERWLCDEQGKAAAAGGEG